MQIDIAHQLSWLPLAEGDAAHCLGHADRRTPRGHAVETIVAVLHRRHGAFTHVYSLSETRRHGRTEVRLETVIAGHDLAAAERFAARLCPAPAKAEHKPLPAAPAIETRAGESKVRKRADERLLVAP
ncbi:hypothetical protein [Aurantimonas sp. VKM B-3413]|uniref:hypothetical protein n=1 Tax=Aurantimonas sp. VKM B-3413 TaxID=2779401 RepID=UPI001E2CD602|nr:hypothetical protein [Aurantimonas sp. VKM B-3413]MCB8839340.1 hypothetical protein [Aurantimonas sp. VKM B-3413]